MFFILKKREFDLRVQRNESAFVNDFDVHLWLLRQEVVGNEPGDEIRHEVVDRTMSGVFNLADVLELIIDRFND